MHIPIDPLLPERPDHESWRGTNHQRNTCLCFLRGEKGKEESQKQATHRVERRGRSNRPKEREKVTTTTLPITLPSSTSETIPSDNNNNRQKGPDNFLQTPKPIRPPPPPKNPAGYTPTHIYKKSKNVLFQTPNLYLMLPLPNRKPRARPKMLSPTRLRLGPNRYPLWQNLAAFVHVATGGWELL